MPTRTLCPFTLEDHEGAWTEEVVEGLYKGLSHDNSYIMAENEEAFLRQYNTVLQTSEAVRRYLKGRTAGGAYAAFLAELDSYQAPIAQLKAQLRDPELGEQEAREAAETLRAATVRFQNAHPLAARVKAELQARANKEMQ
jgi:hypothetical protein